MEDDLLSKTTFGGRQPSVENDLWSISPVWSYNLFGEQSLHGLSGQHVQTIQFEQLYQHFHNCPHCRNIVYMIYMPYIISYSGHY